MGVRVASLLRLSTRKQVVRQGVDGELDIPAQRQAMAEFLRTRPDWEHVREYVEAGVSAFKVSADDRDVLQDALRDAAAGMWQVLIVWKGDRLSRNSAEYPMVITKLFKSGAQVWSVADQPGGKRLGLDNQLDKFLRFLEGWQAETESVNTQIRVIARMRQLAQEGRWNGGRVPFGYDLAIEKDAHGDPLFKSGRVVRRLVPHPQWAPIVQEVFRRYAAGQGGQTLAAWLNARKVPTYFGVRWSAPAVTGLLKNPLYAGLILYGRKAKTADPVLVAGRHEPLVDRETWEQACGVRCAKKGVHPRHRVGTYALTGVLRCGLCGGPMGGLMRRRTDGAGRLVERAAYRCSHAVRCGRCKAVELGGQAVDNALLEALEQLEKPCGLGSLLEMIAKEQDGQRQAAEADRRRAADQLAVVVQAVLRLDKAYLEAGAISLEEYRIKKAEYVDQKDLLEKTITAPLPELRVPDWSALGSLVWQVRTNWAHMTAEERKVFVLNLTRAYGLAVFVRPNLTVELRPEGAVPSDDTAAGEAQM